ncbi:unnamed protein product [Thelazia callipaeda]|uniref:SWIB domain-containing protein n=1 Tax=Thelazia callipaeda TaxID=103827 RepID=A0A0N5CQL8_THECL|nr:unnamed protein product [Thelazia callipaeda]
MTPASSSTTIFDLSKEDLRSILQTLKPTLDENLTKSMSVCELRTCITEWLMLNDLSTMHHFEQIENSQQWKIPDKADHCVSCGKYTVTSIGDSAAKTTNTIIEQPLTSRESLVFVGRSTTLPLSVLQIIDFTKPANATVILKTLNDRNGNEVTNKKKHGYDYGKDLCIDFAQWAFPNFKCFSRHEEDWGNVSKNTSTVNSSNNFMCFSCKS